MIIKKILRVSLIVLTIFLALSAFAGAVQLLEGTYAPPVELLDGSIFRSYALPGLALGILVGGAALLAAVLLIRKSRFGQLFAITCGVIIMTFEFVEIMAIGSPDITALSLQIFYFGLGSLIAMISLGGWFLELRSGGR
jgi:hypothetical protein